MLVDNLRPVIREVNQSREQTILRKLHVHEKAKTSLSSSPTLRDKYIIEHPVNFHWLRRIYEEVPIVTAAINKTVDMMVSTDLRIRSDDLFVEKELEDWAEKTNYRDIVRQEAKHLLIYGNSFTEILAPSMLLKAVNPETMYVRRNENGELLGYVQQYPSRTGVESIYFSTDEIVHASYNKIADNAYGYSIIAPLAQTITNKLNLDQNFQTLLERKANVPYHIRLGNSEEPATQEDVDAYAEQLHYLGPRTEWVTDHKVEINVLDSAAALPDLSKWTEHLENQIVYGLETPVVLLGRGNIPEGLAEVQMEAFTRRIKSLRKLIEDAHKTQIFKKRYPHARTWIEWESPSDKEKWEEITNLSILLSLPLSDDMKRGIEEKIRGLLNLKTLKPAVTTETVTDPTLYEWLGVPMIQEISGIGFGSLLEGILDFLDSYSFEMDLADSTLRKVRQVLKLGFAKNMTLGQMEQQMNQVVGKERAKKIVRTETVRAVSETLLEAYEKEGYDTVQFTVIPDFRACDECRALNGRKFSISQARGKIPVHVNCRCTWQPVL